MTDRNCRNCYGTGWVRIEDCDEDCNGDGTACRTNCEDCNEEAR